MGTRFFRSINLGHEIRLNFTRTGVGISAGVPGLRFGVHSSGRRTASIGIPGTGLSYRKVFVGSRRRRSNPDSWTRPLRCWVGLVFAPRFERAFVRGVLRLAETGDTARALVDFEHSVRWRRGDPVSPSFFAGYCASEDPALAPRAIEYLEQVVSGSVRMPDRLQKRYLGAPTLPIKLTPGVSAEVPVANEAAALLLAELHQGAGHLARAIAVLEKAIEISTSERPGFMAVVVSLVELYCLTERYDDGVRLTEGIRNEDDLCCQALIFRARALAATGACGPAVAALREALRSNRRPIELCLAARYERALVYERMGQHALARKDFEAVYAMDSDYADVQERVEKGAFGIETDEDGSAAFTVDGVRIGAMLREARLRAGLTQRQVAARAGLSSATVSNIEAGITPRRDTLARLMRACEIQPPPTSDEKGA